jgi:osmotically-inducible protein OsmY
LNQEWKEFQLMRLIRRLLLLTIVGVAGVAAYAYWSDNGAALREKATDFATETAKREAGELATTTADEAREAAGKIAAKAADKAGDAAGKLGDTMSDGALTVKIKSKMALDDHVKARAIDVDTSDSVATLSGVVASADERQRALRLARDTEGITRVVDKLEIRHP